MNSGYNSKSYHDDIEKFKLQICEEVFSLVNIVVFLFDPRTSKVNYVSTSINKWGVSEKEISNISDLFDLLHKEDRMKTLSKIKKSIILKEYTCLDCRLTLHDGSVRSVYMQIDALNSYENHVRIIAVDVTISAKQHELQTIPIDEIVDKTIFSQFLKSFSELPNVVANVLDLQGNIIAQSDYQPKFRQYIMSSKSGEISCDNSVRNIIICVKENKQVYIENCDCTGLTMICAPIILNSKVHGFLLYGQLRTDVLTEKNIQVLSEKLALDPNVSLRYFNEMKVFSKQEVDSLLEMTQQRADELSELAQYAYNLKNHIDLTTSSKRKIFYIAKQRKLLTQVYEILLNSTDCKKTFEQCFSLLKNFYDIKSLFIHDDSEIKHVFPDNVKNDLDFISQIKVGFNVIESNNTACVQKLSNAESTTAGIITAKGVLEDEHSFITLLLQNLCSFYVRNRVQSENLQHKEKLEYITLHDVALNVFNRYALDQRLRQELDNDEIGSPVGTFFAIEIDNLDVINNAYGHDVGDILLQAIAKFLTMCFGKNVYRMSGKSFGVWLDYLDVNRVDKSVNLVLGRFKNPWDLTGKLTYSTISCGSLPIYGTSRTFFQNVDLILNAALDRGANSYYQFDSNLKSDALFKLGIANEMYKSAQKDFSQFQVYFQPVVEVKSSRWGYIEALLRWHHPERGMLLPEQFISIAEETTLIIPLSYYMIRQAVRRTVLLKKQGLHWLTCHVNFSLKLAYHDDVIENIMAILEEEGLLPDCLWLELTESMAIFDIDFMSKKFKEFAMQGVNIALDNFGTTFSSLGTLSMLPVNMIILDKNFATNLANNEYSLAVLNFVNEISRVLECSRSCEGIETEAALKEVIAAGEDFVQGFLFSRPLPYVELEKMLLDPQSTVLLSKIINRNKPEMSEL